MTLSNNLKELEIELQQLLDIPEVYMCINKYDDVSYFIEPDLDKGWHPLLKCNVPIDGDDYLYFLLLMSSIVRVETLSNTLDVNLFKKDILCMCIRYLNLLKEVDVDNYQKLYDGLKIRIQEKIC